MPSVRVNARGGGGAGRRGTQVVHWPGAGSNEPLLLRNTGVELAVVATPLGDDRVRIEIDRMTGNDKTADPLTVPTSRARTVITGNLGQWINVGTLTRTSVSRAAQGRLDSSETGQESRVLRIRADLAD